MLWRFRSVAVVTAPVFLLRRRMPLSSGPRPKKKKRKKGPLSSGYWSRTLKSTSTEFIRKVHYSEILNSHLLACIFPENASDRHARINS